MIPVDARLWLEGLYPNPARRWEVISAYKRTFTGALADEVLKDLNRLCHADKTSWCPGDPTVTAFHEGQRAVLCYIKEIMTYERNDGNDGNDGNGDLNADDLF